MKSSYRIMWSRSPNSRRHALYSYQITYDRFTYHHKD